MKVRRELSAREIDQVHESLTRRLGDTSVPTLPQVAMRIVELMGNPNASVKDFTEAIKADQALTGRMLRMANSAAYAQRSPVTKIERAMILIGLEKLKALALGFHLSKVAFEKDDFSFQRIWTQSLYRGLLASKLAERINKEVAGEAFVIAFLADAGLPMMPKLIGSAYRNSVNPDDAPAKQYLAESTTLPYTHVDVAAALCHLWKLPETLSKPIANHHSSPLSMDPKNNGSVLNALAYFAGMIPLDPSGAGAKVTQPVASTARRLFNIDAEELPQLFQEVGEEFDSSRAVFKDILDNSLGIEQIVEQANRQVESLAAADDPETPAEPVETLTFKFNDFSVEMEPAPAPDDAVIVFLTDAAGHRVLSEKLNPHAQDERSIRAALLLDGAPDDQVAGVLAGLRKLADRQAA